MIAEVLAKKRPTQIKFIGMQDTFGESGQPLELIKNTKWTKKQLRMRLKVFKLRKNPVELLEIFTDFLNYSGFPDFSFIKTSPMAPKK